MTEVYIIAALTIFTIILTFVTVSLGDSERALSVLAMAAGAPVALYLSWILLETSAVLTVLVLTFVVVAAMIFAGERGWPAIRVPSTMYPLLLEAVAGMLAFGGVLCIAGDYYPRTLGAFLLVSACATAAAALFCLRVPGSKPDYELLRRALLAAIWMLFALVFVLAGVEVLAALLMLTGGMVVVGAVRPMRIVPSPRDNTRSELPAP